ncbi:MAG: DNA gyrase subunit A, partial [Clostridiaceae bacterium]|nr:DNA gyrase subunit A [Clostridiaceae bacterium]
YIKRLPADTYSSQKRGGRGIQGVTTKEADFVEHIFITSTHNNILLFTNTGKAFRLKAFEIPEGGRTAKGTNLVNIIPLANDEKIQAVISLKEFTEDNYLIMGTKHGLVKKTSLDKYAAIRKNGLKAINLREDDELIGVAIVTGYSEMLFATRNGYSIRFSEKDVRGMGRTATGVKALTLRKDDIVVAMNIVTPEEELLVISANGFGKRTLVSEYSLQHRGGKGVITYKVSEKTGKLVGARIVKDGDEMILINSNGIVIRLNVAGISTTSRNTMGVTLMRSGEGDNIVAIAKINCSDEINTDENLEQGDIAETPFIEDNDLEAEDKANDEIGNEVEDETNNEIED